MPRPSFFKLVLPSNVPASQLVPIFSPLFSLILFSFIIFCFFFSCWFFFLLVIFFFFGSGCSWVYEKFEWVEKGLDNVSGSCFFFTSTTPNPQTLSPLSSSLDFLTPEVWSPSSIYSFVLLCSTRVGREVRGCWWFVSFFFYGKKSIFWGLRS